MAPLKIVMRFSIFFITSLVCGFVGAKSDCPQDPSDGKWSTVDCQKIQLPYEGNSLLPPNPGPFSPPTPLPG